MARSSLTSWKVKKILALESDLTFASLEVETRAQEYNNSTCFCKKGVGVLTQMRQMWDNLITGLDAFRSLKWLKNAKLYWDENHPSISLGLWDNGLIYVLNNWISSLFRTSFPRVTWRSVPLLNQPNKVAATISTLSSPTPESQKTVRKWAAIKPLLNRTANVPVIHLLTGDFSMSVVRIKKKSFRTSALITPSRPRTNSKHRINMSVAPKENIKAQALRQIFHIS